MALTDQLSVDRSPDARAPRRLSLRGIYELWLSRHALAKLDSAGLRDVGIDPEAAQREVAAPFWDVPATWIEPCKGPFAR